MSLGASRVHAQTSAAGTPSVTIEDMRKRDRFNKPSVERAAWQAFLSRVLADPKSSATLKSETHMRMALALYEADQNDKAVVEIKEAEELLTPQILSKEIFAPQLYATYAMILTQLQKYDDAQNYANKSIKAAREQQGEMSGAAAIGYESLSMVAYGRGNFFQAKENGCLAAERAQSYLPFTDSLVASTMMTCGIFRLNLDDDDAIDLMSKAAAIAYKNLGPQNTVVAQALNGSGGALLQLGRYGEAESVFRQEIAAEGALYGTQTVNVYDPMSLLGRALELQHKYAESEAIFMAASTLIHKIDVLGAEPDLRGNAYVNLGNVLEKLGRYSEALTYQRLGQKEILEHLPPENQSAAAAGRSIARILAVTGHFDEAIPLARISAARLGKALGDDHRIAIGANLDLAHILDRSGNHQEAFVIADNASSILESRLADLAAKHSNLVSLSQVVTGAFADVALIALHTGHYDEAVRTAQLSAMSELTLVNAELAARAVARSKGLGALISQLRAANGRLTGLQTSLTKVESGEKGDATALSIGIKSAHAEVNALTAQITSQFPTYAKIARPQPTPLRELQARLTDAQALILPLNLSDRVATIAVTRQRVFWAEANGNGRAVTALADRIRTSIDDARLVPDARPAPFDTVAALALYRALLPGHLGMDVANKAEWLFPASGLASNIPQALLLTRPAERGHGLARASWLIRRHAVSVISDFTMPTAGGSRIVDSSFVGIGDPALSLPSQRPVEDAATTNAIGALPALPGASAELAKMAAAFSGKTHVVVQHDATEAAVKAFDFTPYSVVAFATHGLTSAEVNGLSEPALVLTPPGAKSGDDDGLLTASEIAQLNIPADWVILSACNSGSGRNATAPTYSGLARAFRLAGARSFLLSHWPVRDDAAARLTVDTVKNAAKGMSRAGALQSAILKLMADRKVIGGAHPAIWAPFVLIGN